MNNLLISYVNALENISKRIDMLKSKNPDVKVVLNDLRISLLIKEKQEIKSSINEMRKYIKRCNER